MHASGVLFEVISVHKVGCLMGTSSLSVCKAPVLVLIFTKRNAMKHQISGQTAACCLSELAVNAVHQHSLAILSSDMMSSVRSVSRLLNSVQLATCAVPVC